MYPHSFTRTPLARVWIGRVISPLCWVSYIEIVFNRISVLFEHIKVDVGPESLFCRDIWSPMKTHTRSMT